MIKHLNIKIFGMVQGVLFRISAKEQADKLEITGFVQNLPEGNVYIEAEGEEKILDDFLAWCKKGPKLANVFDIETKTADLKKFANFTIK